MKKCLVVLFMLFSLATFSLIAQNASDALLGTYMTAENKGKVVIIKKNNKYFGTLVWTKTHNKLDSKNPDPKERKKTMAGKEILKNFIYSGDNVWDEGTIYDPETGNTYSCKITKDDDGNLKVRGYIGISLFGRTTKWTKVIE